MGAYYDASKAIGIVADTNIACKMISQSRHIPVSYLYVTVNAFPPRNRVRDLSFFGYLSGDGRDFFPEGRHALCCHCVDECRSTSATEKCELLLNNSSRFHDDVTLF